MFLLVFLFLHCIVSDSVPQKRVLCQLQIMLQPFPKCQDPRIRTVLFHYQRIHFIRVKLSVLEKLSLRVIGGVDIGDDVGIPFVPDTPPAIGFVRQTAL